MMDSVLCVLPESDVFEDDQIVPDCSLQPKSQTSELLPNEVRQYLSIKLLLKHFSSIPNTVFFHLFLLVTYSSLNVPFTLLKQKSN